MYILIVVSFITLNFVLVYILTHSSSTFCKPTFKMHLYFCSDNEYISTSYVPSKIHVCLYRDEIKFPQFKNL